METLYPDTLQFLYHLALAVLVGGGIVRQSVRGDLLGWDGAAILAVVLIVLTSALKAGAFEVSGSLEARLLVRWAALLVTCVATLYSSAWAGPIARTVRTQSRDFESLPASAPARREAAGLDRSAARAQRIAIFAGLVALFLS